MKVLFEGVKVFRWIEIKEIQEEGQFDVIPEWIGLARDISFGCGVQRPSGMFIGKSLTFILPQQPHSVKLNLKNHSPVPSSLPCFNSTVFDTASKEYTA